MHCRLIGTGMLGVPAEIEAEMVTMTGSGGAMNKAFNPGGAKMMLPAFASQVITAFGGISPSRVSGICSPTSSLQSFGSTVTVLVCVAPVPQAAVFRKVNKTAITKIILQDMRAPHLYGLSI